MRLLPWTAALPAVLLVAAACGDGPDASASPTVAATSEATANPLAPSPTEAGPTRAAPTPIPNNAPALTVAGGDKSYVPTVDEFRALPTATVSAGGGTKSGVPIAALGDKVGGAKTTVTIAGTRPDLRGEGVIRHPVADVTGNTVLAIDGSGHVSVVSSTLPEAEWLISVTSVVFD